MIVPIYGCPALIDESDTFRTDLPATFVDPEGDAEMLAKTVAKMRERLEVITSEYKVLETKRHLVSQEMRLITRMLEAYDKDVSR